jgi:hypothetical protein
LAPSSWRAALSSVRGSRRPLASTRTRRAVRSDSARASAASASAAEAARTTMTRSFGPAARASSVRRPASAIKAWLAGVPMSAAASRTPAPVRSSRASPIRATESW